MAYRIAIGGGVQSQVRGVASDEIGRAVRELQDEEIPVDERIHQVRKRLKKLRGLLRLVRPAMGEQYAGANAFFRDLGRELSRFRDAAAMVEAFDSLIEGSTGVSERNFLAAVREALVERRQDLARDSGEPGPDLQRLCGHLVGGLRKTAGWKLSSDGFDAIAAGLRKTYSRSRLGCERAYVEGSAAAFHEWRKRVKYHCYHVRLLRNLWPELMAAHQCELKRLADLLGDDHDLQLVEQHLVTEQAGGADPGTLAKALTALRFRSTELRQEAAPLGTKLFAEKPKRFVQRIGRLWMSESAPPVALAAGSR